MRSHAFQMWEKKTNLVSYKYSNPVWSIFPHRDLENNFKKIFSDQEDKIKQISSDFSKPNMLINKLESEKNILKSKLKIAYEKVFFEKEFNLKSLSKLLESNDFQKILKRGFALIIDNYDVPIKLSSEAKPKSEIKIKFYDKTRAAQLKN